MFDPDVVLDCEDEKGKPWPLGEQLKQVIAVYCSSMIGQSERKKDTTKKSLHEWFGKCVEHGFFPPLWLC